MRVKAESNSAAEFRNEIEAELVGIGRNSVPEFDACFRLIACRSSMQIGIPELDGIGRNSVGYLVDAIPESEELVAIDSGHGTGSRMFNIAE